MKPTITIRVGYKEWKQLQKIFPSIKGESMVAYLKRYIDNLKRQEYEDKLGEAQENFRN